MPPRQVEAAAPRGTLRTRQETNMSRDIGIGFGITIGAVLALVCIGWALRMWLGGKLSPPQRRKHIRTESGDDLSYQQEAWAADQEELRLEMDGGSHPVEAPATPLLTRPPVEIGGGGRMPEPGHREPRKESLGGMARHVSVSIRSDAKRWLGGSWISLNH